MAKEAEFFETDDGKKPFKDWYEGLPGAAQYKVNALVDKAKMGIGTVETITGTSGLFEIKDLTKGPGFRVYFGNKGTKIILLLIGGDKSSQRSDIKTAKAFWELHRLRKAAKKSEKNKVSKKAKKRRS